MPELPEVETTVRGLRQVLDGQRLTHVEARRADLRWPFPVDLRQRMQGATVTSLGRRAKYGLIHTDRGDTMVFHLGMSGRWRIDPDEIGKHGHLVVETAGGNRLVLDDPRRFGSVDLVRTDAVDLYRGFVSMGPEPLDDQFTARVLAKALEGRAAPIKALLLDQRIVAGLGNIYVSEILYRAGIDPRRAAGSIAETRIASLVPLTREVLGEAIEAGGSSLRDYRQADGELGYFQHAFRVYGREGAPCRTPGCTGEIRRIVQSGRSSFYCPKCQR